MPESLDTIFKPKNIAVIGASKQPGSFGHKIIHNLMLSGFEGIIFPVNPSLEFVYSLKCYPSILDIPEAVDMAIILVPAEAVLEVVDACGRKGVKGLLIISSGFKEAGPEGEAREEQLRQLIKSHHMRLLGPNSMGAFNNHSASCMNATLAAAIPPYGNIGFISQSSALGVVVLEMAQQVNLGISMFASMGNKTDISSNDLLEYYDRHPEIRLIVMYLEDLGNPYKFLQIARRVSRRKPIIMVKAGRTPLTPLPDFTSHTSLLSETEAAQNALFSQSGILRVSTIETMFKLAMGFAYQPLPKGDRVAVFSNAEMPGVLSADAVVTRRLTLATLNTETQERLERDHPSVLHHENPVTLPLIVDPQEYGAALRTVLRDEHVDAVLVIYVDPIRSSSAQIIEQIVRVNREFPDKTILSCVMGIEGVVGSSDPSLPPVPVYRFPESAVQALAAMRDYRRFTEKKKGRIRTFPVDKECVAQVFRQVRQQERSLLTTGETRQVLQAYGFQLADSRIVYEADGAVAFALARNKPVALKLISKDIVHKSDVGGVKIDLRSREEIEAAFAEILQNLEKRYPNAQVNGFLVQEMVRGGKETVLGMHHHPRFGPVMMFGLGGINVEVLRDVSFRIAPLTDNDALEMINALKSSPLLKGADGERPVNIGFIIENLQRLSQLTTDFNVISEVDINPLIAHDNPRECKIADARIVLKKISPEAI